MEAAQEEEDLRLAREGDVLLVEEENLPMVREEYVLLTQE